ncbi:hypothetical protein Tco_0485546 [Tanacetum coccineum]
MMRIIPTMRNRFQIISLMVSMWALQQIHMGLLLLLHMTLTLRSNGQAFKGHISRWPTVLIDEQQVAAHLEERVCAPISQKWAATEKDYRLNWIVSFRD